VRGAAQRLVAARAGARARRGARKAREGAKIRRSARGAREAGAGRARARGGRGKDRADRGGKMRGGAGTVARAQGGRCVKRIRDGKTQKTLTQNFPGAPWATFDGNHARTHRCASPRSRRASWLSLDGLFSQFVARLVIFECIRQVVASSREFKRRGRLAVGELHPHAAAASWSPQRPDFSSRHHVRPHLCTMYVAPARLRRKKYRRAPRSVHHGTLNGPRPCIGERPLAKL
jgi:hypothetical protein